MGSLGEMIKIDFDVSPYRQVVFVPNSGVIVAQEIFTASDISKHISTAGTEENGKSNMKYVMIWGLTVGTVDGENIEISEKAKDETMLSFGCAKKASRPRVLALNDGGLRE